MDARTRTRVSLSTCSKHSTERRSTPRRCQSEALQRALARPRCAQTQIKARQALPGRGATMRPRRADTRDVISPRDATGDLLRGAPRGPRDTAFGDARAREDAHPSPYNGDGADATPCVRSDTHRDSREGHLGQSELQRTILARTFCHTRHSRPPALCVRDSTPASLAHARPAPLPQIIIMCRRTKWLTIWLRDHPVGGVCGRR